MAQVSRSVALGASPAEVWSAIGGFQALADWHPAVAASAKEDRGGVEHRRLSLEGGGEIVEKWLGGDAMSYGYAIIEGPLPVADYVSVISVADAGGKAVVVWCSTFTPTADGAEDVIAGVYDGGLSALKDRFGG